MEPTCACMPYPELVEERAGERPYRVEDAVLQPLLPTVGITDKRERRLVVPWVASARSVARHETGHVRWSPTAVPDVPFDVHVLLAVEDARVNLGLLAVGLPVRLSWGDRGRVARLAADDLARGDHGTLLLRAVASIGTEAEGAVVLAAEEANLELARLAAGVCDGVARELRAERERLRREVATFATALRLAERLARLFRAHRLRAPAPAAVAGCLGASSAGGAGEAAGRPEGAGAGGGRGDGAAGAPGTLRVRVAPLDVRCAPATGGRARAWRPAREGSVVRFPHRHPIDGGVFRRRAPTRGGSVLVDTSGSMSLDADDVDRILRDAPNATLVAIYSGRERDGELRIVARDGRRAAPEHLVPYGKANVVDLPALRWLARQPRPRAWISDGRVTGVGDRSTDALRRRCAELCRRARIVRVPDASTAAAVLTGTPRP